LPEFSLQGPCLAKCNKNSSGDEIANVNYLQRYRTYFKSTAHLSLEFLNLLGIYTVVVARSLCRRLLLDTVIVICP